MTTTTTGPQQGNHLYQIVTERMPVTIPPLERATLDAALATLGVTPETVTGPQMEHALRAVVLPNISRWVAQRETFPFRAGLITTDAANCIVTLNANAAIIFGLSPETEYAGMPVADLPTIAACVPPVSSFDGWDDVQFKEYHLAALGRQLQCLSTSRRDASGAPLGVSTTVQDTTMQSAVIAEVDRLYHASERRVRELSALGEIGRQLSLAATLDDTLAVIAEKTTRILGCHAAAIFLPDAEGHLTLRGQYGLPTDYAETVNHALVEFSASASAHEYIPPTLIAYREGKTAFSQLDMIAPEMPASIRAMRAAGEEHHWAAIAAVPLIAQAEIIGALTCYLGDPAPLSPDETRLLTAIAGQTAVSVRNRMLTAETQHQLEEMRALHESAARLNSSLDRDAVLHLIVEQAAKLTDARVAVLAELVEGSNVLVARAAYSRGGPMTKDFAGYGDEFDMPIFRDGPAVHAIRERHPVVIRNRDEMPQQPWFKPEMAARWHDVNMHALIAVPFGYEDQYDASLMLMFDRAISPAEGEMQLIGAFADHAAVAMHNTRLYAQAQQAAALEERHRLARDLHDSVTQSLFSMSLLAQATPALFTINPEEATNSLRELQRLSKEALAEMRALLFQLRPVALEEDGLVEALTKHIASLQRRDGPELRFTCNNCSERFPRVVEEMLFRVAIEAINNALKHANAKHIVVHMEQEADIVTLSIHDDGAGFDPTTQHPEPGHLGLSGMRERVSRTGGVFTLESTPGAGTTVLVRAAVPLNTPVS